ncbi:MAG: UvrD-helicase domain-containing protein, partial [Planctomycetota bacterium]
MPDRDQANLPPDRAERRRIETELKTTMLVEAAAGTGKTTCLVKRMVALLAEGECGPGRLAAVTFTRKAAAELRARFAARLEESARGASGERQARLTTAPESIHECFIGTIHAFCGRLLRERPVEAGVEVGFEELDEDEEYRLRDEAWNEYVARLHGEKAGNTLLDELAALDLGLDRLREAYLTYADYPDVASWPAAPAQLDQAALDAARQTLRDLARHAEGLSLPEQVKSDELIPFYRDLERRLRNTRGDAELLRLLELAISVDHSRQADWNDPKEGKAEWVRWNAFLDTHAKPLVAAWRHRRYEPALRVLREAAAHYERLRADHGALSFQDLLMNARRLLREKPHVRRYFRARFTHLLVDEFQDTDPIQAEVMLLLTADDPDEKRWRECRPVPGALFVVGDPKQSIYRFRRADIVTYNQVRDIIREHGAEV